MNYSDKLKYVQKYLTDEMTSSEKESFVTWVDESEENKVLYEQLGGIWDNATYIQSEEFNYEDAYNKHLTLLNKPKINESSAKIIKFNYFRSIAAVLVFALLSIAVFKWSFDGQIIEAKDESIFVTLDDGTNVWLDKDSKLQISKMTENSRLVKLVGKAFFDVAHQNNNPFKIETKNAEIKVLGTKFLVDTKSEFVNVKEGKVEVSNQQKAVILTKNQSVSFKDRVVSDIKDETFNTNMLWFNEDLVFDNVAFDKVISDISKEYALTIELPEQNNWKNCGFTSGSLKGNTIEQIIMILEITYELEYTKISPNSYKFTKVNCK